MNGYINTRPLFEEFSNGHYCDLMENRIRKLNIKDYYIFQRKTNASGRGVGKANYYMTREDWNRVKETLKEVQI